MKLIFCLSINVFCLGQGFSFIYESKLNTSIDKSKNSRKSYMSLDVIDGKSIFRENIDKKADSTKSEGESPMFSAGFENQYYVKKDLNTTEVIKIITNGRNNFSLPITEKLIWNVTSEKRKMGNYNIQKATTSYGGRKWIAWFTKDITVNDGPYIFNGLPGLIISLSDLNNDYIFNLIQVRKISNLFDTRTKPLLIDWKKFKDLCTSYYNNPYPELMHGAGSKVSFFDKDGNPVDIAIQRKRMTINVQEYIIDNNNPIELNHKIEYK